MIVDDPLEVVTDWATDRIRTSVQDAKERAARWEPRPMPANWGLPERRADERVQELRGRMGRR